MVVAIAKHRLSACAEGDALVATGVSKRFGNNCAVDNVDLLIRKGEVHALIGKNGAGKSTLVKIISGAHAPDAGEIQIRGERYHSFTPSSARKAGISVVYQNQEMLANFTVAQNIFLGCEFSAGFGVISESETNRAAAELLQKLQLDIPATAKLGDLSAPLRQQVAIAKAVRDEAAVLLLDEPTAALNKIQAEFLFTLVRRLADDGMGILYISHHLQEILSLANRVTVLRDGKNVGVVGAAGSSKAELISLMVGQAGEGKESRTKSRRRSPHTLLNLTGISVPQSLSDVSLQIRRGEILGITGLIGSGTETLSKVLSGRCTAAAGEMTLDENAYRPLSTADAIKRGVTLVPEDMRGLGLIMSLPIRHNITIASVKTSTGKLLVNHAKERRIATAHIHRFRIAPADTEYEVGLLSGGNQRKVLLARATETGARLFILEEPTQGVDVDAQNQLHGQLRTLADSGCSIVLFSTDLEELIGVADRVIVLRKGRIYTELDTERLSPSALLGALQESPEALRG
jgi:ribose transport system ATP-binding protein